MSRSWVDWVLNATCIAVMSQVSWKLFRSPLEKGKPLQERWAKTFKCSVLLRVFNKSGSIRTVYLFSQLKKICIFLFSRSVVTSNPWHSEFETSSVSWLKKRRIKYSYVWGRHSTPRRVRIGSAISFNLKAGTSVRENLPLRMFSWTSLKSRKKDQGYKYKLHAWVVCFRLSWAWFSSEFSRRLNKL